MLAAGLWQSRAQRHRVHQPRLRRAALGELIQIDGSEHRWFEKRGPVCTLLVFIDDATSRLMQMKFVPSEATQTYFAALESYLLQPGRPVAFYSAMRPSSGATCPIIAANDMGVARDASTTLNSLINYPFATGQRVSLCAVISAIGNVT